MHDAIEQADLMVSPATEIRLKLNLVVLIIGDRAYGIIRWKQAVDRFADYGMTFQNPDFVKYA